MKKIPCFLILPTIADAEAKRVELGLTWVYKHPTDGRAAVQIWDHRVWARLSQPEKESCVETLSSDWNWPDAPMPTT